MKNLEYLILVFFIYTNLFFGVTSKSIPINIFQEIGNGTGPAACKTVEFLLKSNYTKSCAHETFPVTTTTLEDDRNQTILCLALYDYSSKWCSRSSENIELPEFENAAAFDSKVAKFASVQNIEKFCESEKNSGNATLAAELEHLYKHSAKCSLYCTYRSNGSYIMPREICSALSWIDYNLRTHTEVSKPFATSQNTAKLNVKTDKTEEQNMNTKNPEVKIAVVDNKVEDKISNKTKELESGKIPSTSSNDKSSPVIVPKLTDKLSASQANTEANSDKAKNSVAKNDNKENLSKLDLSSVSGNPVTEPKKAPKKEEGLADGVENTEVKPPSLTLVSTINKKPETSDGKVQKPAEDKSNTLSENTDEFNENLGIGGEDTDFQVPPVGKRFFLFLFILIIYINFCC